MFQFGDNKTPAFFDPLPVVCQLEMVQWADKRRNEILNKTPEDYKELYRWNHLLDFKGIRDKTDEFIRHSRFFGETATLDSYIKHVESEGRWKTWTQLVPLAIGLHKTLGVKGISSSYRWINLLEICYRDFLDADEEFKNWYGNERRTLEACRKIEANADAVKACNDCNKNGRVYVTEGMWATCHCAGGDGLSTDIHEW